MAVIYVLNLISKPVFCSGTSKLLKIVIVFKQ